MDFNDLKMSVNAADLAFVADTVAAKQEAEAEAKREAARVAKELAEKKRYEFIKDELETISRLITVKALNNERVLFRLFSVEDENDMNVIIDALYEAGFDPSYHYESDGYYSSGYNLEIRF